MFALGSTFGNALQPSSDNLEVGFSIVLVVCGLVLFMLLIGNIQACQPLTQVCLPTLSLRLLSVTTLMFVIRLTASKFQ